jgi:GNAT superfamily N-acetyltransferase
LGDTATDAGVLTPSDLAHQLEQDLGIRVFLMEAAGGVTLSSLIVPRDRQRQGLGSQAMERLCAEADAQGWRLFLSPGQKDDRHGTTSRARLVRFYKRFGFWENTGRRKDFALSAAMVRDPRTVVT